MTGQTYIVRHVHRGAITQSLQSLLEGFGYHHLSSREDVARATDREVFTLSTHVIVGKDEQQEYQADLTVNPDMVSDIRRRLAELSYKLFQ